MIPPMDENERARGRKYSMPEVTEILLRDIAEASSPEDKERAVRTYVMWWETLPHR